MTEEFLDVDLGPEAPYRVSLPIFEGPLDLLLHLIEREELDITAVSLVQVTDQYLAYVQSLTRIQADALADFLVIAARLLLIKSEALLPRPLALPGQEEEEDPGEQLARQLREYKRFKAVALGLGRVEQQELQSFVRVASPPRIQSKIDLEGVTLDGLLDAARQALAVLTPAPPVNGVVKPFAITIHERADAIVRRARAGERFTFRSLLEDARSRIEIVVTLLAVLELLKRRQISVCQEELFGEIQIQAAAEGVVVPPALAEDEEPDWNGV